jgi:hypothetical protein
LHQTATRDSVGALPSFDQTMIESGDAQLRWASMHVCSRDRLSPAQSVPHPDAFSIWMTNHNYRVCIFISNLSPK